MIFMAVQCSSKNIDQIHIHEIVQVISETRSNMHFVYQVNQTRNNYYK